MDAVSHICTSGGVRRLSDCVEKRKVTQPLTGDQQGKGRAMDFRRNNGFKRACPSNADHRSEGKTLFRRAVFVSDLKINIGGGPAAGIDPDHLLFTFVLGILHAFHRSEPIKVSGRQSSTRPPVKILLLGYRSA